MFKCTGICSLCGRCHRIERSIDSDDRKTKLLFLPEDFQPDTGEQGYGIAFDIGTTTVVGIMWDLFCGKPVGSVSMTNPQIKYGSDVISRIAFSSREGNLSVLHAAVIDCLNSIVEKICEQYEIKRESIVRAVACGNTTMSHLLLGIDPKSLAVAPFLPAYEGTVIRSAGELGLKISENAAVTVIPNIAGHVGGDITAGILATRLQNLDGNRLLVDIGTNGEIVLISNGKMSACSTAAGPAFEGASIYQGMRAADGVIERVRIKDGDVELGVIGESVPIGICGSGLIDCVAQMVKNGIADSTGRMLSAEEYTEKYGESPLAERLVEDEQGRKMILVSKSDSDDVVITQKDIREVQLAKAAIISGIRLMMKKAGITAGMIDAIYLAGAFGNFIDKESAVTIGLLPDTEYDKIVSVGNSAGAGALMALACSKEQNRIRQIPEKVTHIDLSAEAEFQKEFLNAMSF